MSTQQKEQVKSTNLNKSLLTVQFEGHSPFSNFLCCHCLHLQEWLAS
uniref:Uncharacterized protein n=1 Tax=Rhizophora mucronata TaxID=61149 RepID=A0A2P2IN84_RHIMU